MRQSNMELLRIIAMFLILVVHADYFSLGSPIKEDFNVNAISAVTRVIIEYSSIIAVNLFVGISGWFLIRPSIKGFLKFIFQILYFFIGIYVFLLISGKAEFDFQGIKICLFLTEWNWFIKSYIGLYLLTPIINIFLERASERQVRNLLAAFYLFQTVYSYNNSAAYIDYGYSAFSFVGLYILARYARLYIVARFTKMHLIILNLTPILLNVLIGCICVYFEMNTFSIMLMSYTNPLTIVSAVAGIMLFSKISIGQSRLINFISASSFAVFLLHCNPYVVGRFSLIVKSIFENYEGLVCLLMEFCLLVLIYFIAVLLDQPRKFLWSYLNRWLFEYKARSFNYSTSNDILVR